MSLLQSTLRETLSHAPERLEDLSALIDPAWIEQALAVSGKGSIRRRKLPAEHAVWLVIGLALFRKLPLWQVVQQMELSLDTQELPAPSASVQARQRLGEEPLAKLFRLLTHGVARRSHARRLYECWLWTVSCGRHRRRPRTAWSWAAAAPSTAPCPGRRSARLA